MSSITSRGLIWQQILFSTEAYRRSGASPRRDMGCISTCHPLPPCCGVSAAVAPRATPNGTKNVGVCLRGPKAVHRRPTRWETALRQSQWRQAGNWRAEKPAGGRVERRRAQCRRAGRRGCRPSPAWTPASRHRRCTSQGLGAAGWAAPAAGPQRSARCPARARTARLALGPARDLLDHHETHGDKESIQSDCTGPSGRAGKTASTSGSPKLVPHSPRGWTQRGGGHLGP